MTPPHMSKLPHMTHVTRLINVSDACKDGCLLAAADKEIERLEAALDHILKLTEAFDKAPVQSRSVERRYVRLITRAVRAALTGAS